jgi:hypothetical protein
MILILSVILFIIFFIYQTQSIFSGELLKNKGTNKNWYILCHYISFLIVVGIVFNLGFSFYAHFKAKNKVGIRGEKGTKGLKGDKGRPGKCTDRCGQKTCYVSIYKHINQKIKEATGEEIKNKFLLSRINKICHSNSYQQIIRKDHKNKPNERKLINFIKGTISKWIDIILSDKKGASFLTSEEKTIKLWEDKGPFNEIEKYDIWGWSSDDILTKPIIKKQCSKPSRMPRSDDAIMNMMFTNNYYPIYSSKKTPDQFGPRDCPYNQLGKDFTNPKNIKSCLYPSNSGAGYYKELYPTKKVIESKFPVSIYHPKKYTTSDGQEFYPVGSVWRGNNSYDRPENVKNYPEDQDSNEIGPSKRTILVSGDVKSPERYVKIWTSNDRCEECHPTNNVATIWRPIPPIGYVSLGDVATLGETVPDDDYVKCVPKKCVQEMGYQGMVWSSGGEVKKYKNRLNYLNDNYYSWTRQKPIHLWATGLRDTREEMYNRPKMNLGYDGGYNLFTATRKNNEPKETAYRINQKCFSTKVPKAIHEELYDKAEGLLTNGNRKAKYSVYTFSNKVPLAIITSTNSEGSPSGEPKKFYLMDSKSRDYKEAFHIKAYNKINNSFSDCLYARDENIVERTSECDSDNVAQLWKIVVVKDYNGEEMRDPITKELLIKIISISTNKIFKQYYDNKGVSKEIMVELTQDIKWKFNSAAGDIIPQ